MTPLVFFALAFVSGPDRASQSELLLIVNSYRTAHGVEQVKLDDRLCYVADGHAQFMARNRTLTHRQNSALPSFTGTDLAARASQVGWRDDLSELVGYANTNLEDTVQAIFDSPCHRSRFLLPGKHTLGASAEGEYVCLLIGGSPTGNTVLSPPDQATAVPTYWHGANDFSGTRTGPGGSKFGYPILYISDGLRVNVNGASVTDPNGDAVPLIIRDRSNDHHYQESCAIIPKSPLLPGTTYNVVIDVTVDNKPKSESWSFTTKK